MHERALHAVILLLAAPAYGQTNLVPPSLEQQRLAERAKSARDNAIQSGALELPGAVLQGGAMLQRSIGGDGSVLMMQGANAGGEIIRKHVMGAQLVGAAIRDGSEGFWRESSQIVLDESGQAVGEFAKSFLVNRAIASGASAVAAQGAAGIAFSGGWIAGQYLREKTGIGDTIDDLYFKVSPDWLKEAVSGTPQINIDDEAWQRNEEAKARARIRANAFAAVQQENAEQQRQIDAARASAAAAAAPSEPGDPGDGLLTGINAMINTMQAAAARNAAAEAGRNGACTPARTLDPKTGCHSGHDEKVHPGGCKCG